MLRFHQFGRLFSPLGSRRNARRRVTRNRPALVGESLERRLLLSAISGNIPAEVSVHVCAADAGPVQQLNLSIVGTTVQFDGATGLPAFLAGDLYHADGRYAGTYEETLTPILHPDYGFIGTAGVSTFRFQNETGTTTFGEVTTRNLSYIVAMDYETGAIQVVSSGEIVEGTRRMSNVDGGISSSSTVVLGPAFALDVHLTMQFSTQTDADAGGDAVSSRTLVSRDSGTGAHFPLPDPPSTARDRVLAKWDA